MQRYVISSLSSSFGDRAFYAGKMLLIGMGVTFLSLAALWFILELFHRAVEGKKEEKQVEESAAPDPLPSDDNELLAVITAAVAAVMAEENGGSAPAFRAVKFVPIATTRHPEANHNSEVSK